MNILLIGEHKLRFWVEMCKKLIAEKWDESQICRNFALLTQKNGYLDNKEAVLYFYAMSFFVYLT